MLTYGIDDIRLFHGNDLRFLRQFPWHLYLDRQPSVSEQPP